MIPARRHVIDRAGIARLWGLTWATALRRQPWADPGHPAPLYTGRPLLWDRDQANAYAAGRPVPALPAALESGDRLDRGEVAARLNILPRTVSDYVRGGHLPEPDEVHFEVRFWRRGTLDAFERPGQGRFGGGNRTTHRDEATGHTPEQDRVLAVLAGTPGQRLSAWEVARRAGVNPATARKYMNDAP